jgi:hypothetical protein
MTDTQNPGYTTGRAKDTTSVEKLVGKETGMLDTNPYLAERSMQMSVAEHLQQARSRSLTRLVAGEPQTWLSRHCYQALREMGRQLVALGTRLESLGLPQSPSLQSRMGESR